MRTIKALGICSLLVLSACGKAPETPDFYTPDQLFLRTLNTDDSKVFTRLPLEGQVEEGNRFWSGDFWPLNKGMINKRWYSSWNDSSSEASPTREEAAQMSEEALARLSPSEKFDLLLGRYDYPLKNEVAKKINPVAMNWEGIGNGWALASVTHQEPTPKVLENPDGVQIPFGSSDIKALLSYYYAFHYQAPSQQLGLRCDQRYGWGDQNPECKDDLNAGSFHIVLANVIGLKGMSFMADLERYQEVWNHPITGYRAEVIKEGEPEVGAPAGTTRSVHLKTSISYVDQSWSNSWGPIKETRNQVNRKRLFSYVLHLNAEGLIIGGSWKSSDRPDFIWLMRGTTTFSGDFQAIQSLIDD